MIRFLLLTLLVLFLARAVWRLFEGIVQGAADEGRSERDGKKSVQSGVKMVRDPVCGTYVVPTRALTTTHGGDTFYFCSEKCRIEFRKR